MILRLVDPRDKQKKKDEKKKKEANSRTKQMVQIISYFKVQIEQAIGLFYSEAYGCQLHLCILAHRHMWYQGSDFFS